MQKLLLRQKWPKGLWSGELLAADPNSAQGGGGVQRKGKPLSWQAMYGSGEWRGRGADDMGETWDRIRGRGDPGERDRREAGVSCPRGSQAGVQGGLLW